MYKIGLTGGIATGKTTVRQILEALGVPVVDADGISRALTAPGGAALADIREAFGDGVFEGRELRRGALADRIFSDPDARQRLNAIMLPRIRAGALDALRVLEGQGVPVAALDMPLLFEMGFDREVDTLWLCDLPEETRLSRLMARNGLSREQALARMESQQSQAELLPRADVVIWTGGTVAQTKKRVEEALAALPPGIISPP